MMNDFIIEQRRSTNGCHITDVTYFHNLTKSLFVYTNTNISCLNVEIKCSSGSRRYWCSKGLHNVTFVVVDFIFLTMRPPVA